MNKKRIIIATFALTILLSSLQSLLAMNCEKEGTCDHTQKNSLQSEYSGFKARVSETTNNIYETGKEYADAGVERAKETWYSSDNIDKILMIGTAVITYYLYSQFFPKAANVTNILAKYSIFYLAYKSLFAPKPAEQTWSQEIRNDISGAYNWGTSFFVNNDTVATNE